MDNWDTVFSTTEEFEAERVKNLPLSENIPAVILNRKDSSYTMLGEINVMVNQENAETAKQVIKNNEGE